MLPDLLERCETDITALDRGADALAKRRVPIHRRTATAVALLLGGIIAAGDSPASLCAQTPAGRNRPVAGAREDADVLQMSANELLRHLPDRFPVKSEFGKYAKVEKCETPDAKYLVVVLRNIHKSERKKRAGEQEPPLVQKIIDASELVL